MPNPLDNLGPSRCSRCRSQPCRCRAPRNPLAGPLCVRCQCNPCCCLRRRVQSRLCIQCGLNPCRCGEAPPCVPVPYDEYAKCPYGYQVGDILTLVGGTFVTACTVMVATIDPANGAVLTVTITFAGSYSVFPANPVATTGGQGTGCTLNITATAGTSVTAVAVQAGGTAWPPGYRVGDVCQLEGGVFTAPASVLVTAVTGGGQVTGISIRTPGTGYSVNPCSPTPTFGGHGCNLKITATFVGGAMTVAVIADMGGPCWTPPRQWFERTPVNIFPAGSGPPSQPRNTAKGLLQPGWCLGQELMVDGCVSPPTGARPVTYLTLPGTVDINAACCDVAGDVVEVPAGSGRLYNVWWVEFVGLDLPANVPGPQGGPCVQGEYNSGQLLVILIQQCPFGAAPIAPPDTWLSDDSGVDMLLADPWHYLTPA